LNDLFYTPSPEKDGRMCIIVTEHEEWLARVARPKRRPPPRRADHVLHEAGDPRGERRVAVVDRVDGLAHVQRLPREQLHQLAAALIFARHEVRQAGDAQPASAICRSVSPLEEAIVGWMRTASPFPSRSGACGAQCCQCTARAERSGGAVRALEQCVH
jgi:hypothetical protein